MAITLRRAEHEFAPDLCGGTVSVALGEPASIVEDAPFLEGLVEFLDGVEVADPEERFLMRRLRGLGW